MYAIIGDLHFGKKEDHDIFVKYQIQSYLKVIESIKKQGIKTIILAGDICDNRKYITYTTLQIIKKHIIDPELNYIIVVGNHDAYYKNTNKLNAPKELFGEFENVTIIDNEPKEIIIDKDKCLFVPWMNKENSEICMKSIKTSNAKYCFGHFDINGAQMTKGILCGSSLRSDYFKKFERVFSGHFHLTQEIGNIIYIGSMCQLDWNDYGDKKRIIIIDRNDLISQSLVDEIFVKININNEYKFENLDQYKDKFLRIYINRKLKKIDETKLIEIIENSVKHEIIDNTIILDEAITIEEDEEFVEIVKECIESYEGEEESVKKESYELIIGEYNNILAEE